ncbi:TPA: Ig-like domain-containing protein [Vibrio parahaemolyticus]
MLDKSWLKGLLTPAKRKMVMWQELADAITDALNEYVSPNIERLKSRGSLFDQGQEDLEIELRELGDDFAYGDVTEENLPIIIMQREDEFHFKNTLYPLRSTIAREFPGKDITWEPLYAPKDGVYGKGLIIKNKFGGLEGYQREDYFLTSRGVIRISLESYRTSISSSIEDDPLFEFENHLRRVAYPLIPLDIVLEGQMYFKEFHLNELPEVIELTYQKVNQLCIFEETKEDLSLSVTIDSSYELEEGLRSPAYAEMRDGPIGLDDICLDFEVVQEFLNMTLISLIIDASDLSLNLGDFGRVIATLTYDNGFVRNSIDDPTIVSWSTSDASIVTIDEDGNYTVNAAGDVTITATSTEDSAITDVVNITTTIDYDFVLTVGHPSTSYFYYGYSQSNYGNVEPNAWGDSKHAIIGLGAHTEGSSPAIYPLSFSCDAMDLWNDLQNIKLKFFTETEFVESPASNGFRYTQSGAYTFDDAMDVYVLLRENVDKSVYVKVLEAPSTEINNSIEMTVGAYSDSSFNVYGYRSSSNTGAMAGKFNSGSSITTCYVRDAYYGMVIQSEVKNEYWNGWEYMHATWEFEDGTSHVYAGRLLMHSGQGFYTSSVIDDELIALAQNNLNKSVTVTLSHAETPSNVIEIEIGEVEISTGDTAYGLRTSSSTGSLISGEFPDASPVVNAYVRTKGFGCLIGGAFERSYWNYQSTIAVTWEFEDGTTYEYPEALEYSYNSTSSESYYESSYIDDTLIAMISSRVGQTAKITVTTPSTSKILTHLYWDYLHWELDDSARI